ncbi:MAG: sugar phosphate nucleotidyltransferase [Thermoplasmata archaeon]
MAGGLGTRLRPITDKIPKSLIPVAGKPIVFYLMDSLSRASNDFILTVSYRYEKIIDLFSGPIAGRKNILFSVEKEPLGTAGGLKKVEKFIDGTFVVGNADTIFQEDVRNIVKFHKRNRNTITLGLTEVEDPSEYGVVKLRSGRIIEFQEKPKSNPISRLANAGLYIMEPTVFDYINRGRAEDVARDLLPRLQNDGMRIGGYRMTGTWIDIGRPQDLIRANIFVAERKRRNIRGISGSAYIGKGVKIGKGCELEDVAIYDNVTIEDNVRIKNSVIYDSSFVGKGSSIRNSILSFGSVLGEGVIISDSVIGGGLMLRKGGKIEGTVVSSSE